MQKFLFNSVLSVLSYFSLTTTACLRTEQQIQKFPEGFLWGTATASYQIEGAWNVDGTLVYNIILHLCYLYYI